MPSTLEFRWEGVNFGSSERSLDHFAVHVDAVSCSVMLADGAGGMANGDLAARHATAVVSAGWQGSAGSLAESAVMALATIDGEIVGRCSGGQCTGVLAIVTHGSVTGASVGDSGAWWCTEERYVDLTAGQSRKPLLGSGDARPVGYSACHDRGRLLVASDGLFKYATGPRVHIAAMTPDLNEALRRLVALVRLPGGTLQDDVSIVLVEARQDSIGGFTTRRR